MIYQSEFVLESRTLSKSRVELVISWVISLLLSNNFVVTYRFSCLMSYRIKYPCRKGCENVANFLPACDGNKTISSDWVFELFLSFSQLYTICSLSSSARIRFWSRSDAHAINFIPFFHIWWCRFHIYVSISCLTLVRLFLAPPTRLNLLTSN